MIFDDLGWSLMIFRNHVFYDFTRFCHLHHLEESASHPFPLPEGVPQLVRSILLQVIRGSQTGPRGFLLSGFPVTLWSTLSLVKLHHMDHSRFHSQWFLMLFPMVYTPFPCEDGNLWNIGLLPGHIENHEKLMTVKSTQEYSGDV